MRLDPYPHQSYISAVQEWYSTQTPYPAAINVATGEAFPVAGDPELVYLDPGAGFGGAPAQFHHHPGSAGSRFGAGATGLQLAAAMPAPRATVTNPHPAFGLQGVAAGKTFMGISGRDVVAAGIGAALVWSIPRLFGRGW